MAIYEKDGKLVYSINYKVVPQSRGETLVGINYRSLTDLQQIALDKNITKQDIVDLLKDCLEKANSNRYK